MKKWFSWKWFIPLLACVIAVACWAYYNTYVDRTPTLTQAQENTAIVERGDIQVFVSGSGTVTPERGTVSTIHEGTIENLLFTEGDLVSKDQLLMTYEQTDVTDQLTQQQLNLERKQLELKEAEQDLEDKINNLQIKAPTEGYVIDLLVEEGDEVQQGQRIGTIKQVDVKYVTASFYSTQVEIIEIGQEANVFLLDSFYSLEGTVIDVSRIGNVAQGGGILYDVTIEIDGYPALEDGLSTQVTIFTPEGELLAVKSGEIFSPSTEDITSPTSGTVDEIIVIEEEKVEKGQPLVNLVSNIESLENNIRFLQLEIEEIQKTIDSLQDQDDIPPLTAPIEGEIVSKTDKVQEGSKVTAGTEVAEIVNYGELSMTIQVDELDILKVQVGQQAEITVEAIPDQLFSGEVIEVAKEGVSSNGVSSFDVTIRFNEAEGVLAGMTAYAKIIVEEKQNVLLVPIEAVQDINGGKGVFMPQDTESQSRGQSTNQAERSSLGNGRMLVSIEVGIHNEDMIEVVSGLQEGDRVIIPNVATQQQSGREEIFPGGYRERGTVGFPSGNGTLPRGGR